MKTAETLSPIKQNNDDTLKSLLYLSGTAIFALLASVILHEFGHALAVLITKNQVTEITFNPFANSVTRYSLIGRDPAAEKLISAGGVIFGSMFSLFIAFPFILRFQNHWTIPLAMIAVASLTGNGLMLLIGSVTEKVTDVAGLLSLGVSRGLILSSGVFLLILSLYLFLRISPALGLGPKVPLGKRCFIFIAGVAPYIICVLSYNAIKQFTKLGFYVMYILAGLLLSLMGLSLCGYLQNRLSFDASKQPQPLRWIHVNYSCFLALLLFIILIQVFPCK